MSKMSIYEDYCPKCHDSMEFKLYDSVNVTLNPELKKKILRGKFFNFKCPNCGKTITKWYDFLYCDMDKNLMLHFGYKNTLLAERELGYLDLTNIKVAEEFVSKINIVAAGEYDDLITRICCIDLGFDYRIMRLAIMVCQKESLDKYNSTYKGKGEVTGAVFKPVFDRHGEIKQYVIEVTVNEEKYILEDYEKKYEEMCGLKVIKKIEKLDDFYVDDITVQYVLDKEDEEEYTIAIVELENRLDIATIPSFNKNKFKEGDIVSCSIRLSSKKHEGIIRKIINTTDPNYRLEPSRLFVTDYSRDFYLKECDDKNAEINNDDLLTLLNKQKNENHNYIYDKVARLIFNSKVILKQEYTDDGEGYLTFRVTKGSTRPSLVVYTSQDEFKLGDDKGIFRFDDVIRYYINTGYFANIIINPDSDNITLHHYDILEYLRIRLMVDGDRMRELLDKLNDDEIKAIGEESYKYIYDCYHEKTSPKLLAEKYGKREAHIDRLLDEGYDTMRSVCLYNYVFSEYKD